MAVGEDAKVGCGRKKTGQDEIYNSVLAVQKTEKGKQHHLLFSFFPGPECETL